MPLWEHGDARNECIYEGIGGESHDAPGVLEIFLNRGKGASAVHHGLSSDTNRAVTDFPDTRYELLRPLIALQAKHLVPTRPLLRYQNMTARLTPWAHLSAEALKALFPLPYA